VALITRSYICKVLGVASCEMQQLQQRHGIPLLQLLHLCKFWQGDGDVG